ncbi:MAG TPA: rhodanese-like domain-containing protein [Solirubrobacteraceae bacterium]|jgi:rhodanese-related sulfurtransferase|nr:rhodanese-like domain-containing protein [Solirubrobacteraceae bacterium]
MTDTTITRDELQAAIAAGDVVVVETLGPQYYEDAHLPGAINIPHTEVARLAPALLPDKATRIVTYCSNLACRNSEMAAAQLRALGYADVRKYAEGKEDWREAGLALEHGAAVPA